MNKEGFIRKTGWRRLDPSPGILNSQPMKSSFWLGTACGVTLSVLLGLSLAALPLTPSWTLLRLAHAIDTQDTAELSTLIDFPAVAQRGLNEITRGSQQKGERLDIGSLALALVQGARIRTIFDDPEQKANISASELSLAWWNMKREGSVARMTLNPLGQPVHLTMAPGSDGRWQIIGIEPLAGLLRVESRDS